MADNPNESLRPEEVLKGISKSSLDAYSVDEIRDFVSEWSEGDAFVEDLERVIDSFVRQELPPEVIFERLVSSKGSYTVEEMLDFAEEWSNEDCQDHPEIGSTGHLEDRYLGDVVTVPRQDYFIPLKGDYVGETGFTEDGKSLWIQEHSDGWFQTEVEPVEKNEFRDFFKRLESLSPANGFLEVAYGNCVYFLDSEELNFYFEFEDRSEEFEDEVYRIDADFGDVMMEASKIPGRDDYRVSIFSGEGRTYPLDAYREILSENVVNGLESRIELPTP